MSYEIYVVSGSPNEDAYPKLCQISKMKLSAKDIFAKSYILDAWQGSEYAFEKWIVVEYLTNNQRILQPRSFWKRSE